jgi:hypothetical protein
VSAHVEAGGHLQQLTVKVLRYTAQKQRGGGMATGIIRCEGAVMSAVVRNELDHGRK